MRARTKKVVIGDAEEVGDLFNKMLNADGIDMNIAYAKYIKVKELILSITDIFSALIESALMQNHPDLKGARADLERFVATTRAEVKAQFNLVYPGFEWNYALLDEAKRKHFATQWADIKTSTLVNQMIVCCSRLMPYKAYIADPNKLSADFIKSMCGLSWQPFPFTKLDILWIYGLPGVGAHTLTALVAVIHKVWSFTKQIHDTVSSPDINVDEFAAVIMENLSKIESIPDLSRCKDAFRKIKEALGMLKGNFPAYYREFVSTGDSSTILQSFLLDVQNSTDASPTLTHQFNTIIGYYRKNVAKSSDDPRLKATMDKLQSTMDQISRGADKPSNVIPAPASTEYLSVLVLNPEDSTVPSNRTNGKPKPLPK